MTVPRAGRTSIRPSVVLRKHIAPGLVVITSNTELAAAPGNFLLRRRDTTLSKDSVINVSQLITLDRSFLTERVGELPKRLIGVLDEGLRLVLGL